LLFTNYLQPCKNQKSANIADFRGEPLQVGLSLLGGFNLHTGQIHAQVHDRHRCREFIELLKEIDSYYTKDVKIVLFLITILPTGQK
jgi:hypothetical protein